jgi:filamentous hemagglutinin family protein
MFILKNGFSYLLLTSIITSTSGAYAQSITTGANGLNTNVDQVGNQYNITGGIQAGGNLFYSLQKLGLSTGEIANFLSNPNVQNVLTRVTGGEASLINGLIQVTGGNSNLFILNPAGIVFGANASLNIPASFSATTASGIQVGNGWFGINSSVDEVRNLTGNVTGYAFTNTLPSVAPNLSGVILNEGNLNVSTGKSVTLVGGMVVNTGTIATPSGNITIAATPDNKFIKITSEGSLISLELPISDRQAVGNAPVLKAVDLPSLLTGKTAGTAIVNGELTATNIDILSDRYDTSQAKLNANKLQQGWNYVFIDANVKNYQTLVNGTIGGSNVNVIETNQNGISKISQTLANVSGANSLHIVSEGDKGNFWVGKDFISNERIGMYENDFSAWKLSLSPAAEVMIYACNLAGDASGKALVQSIASFIGSPVAASIDRTGGTVSNANWNLEYSTSAMRSPTIFTATTQQNYANALALYTVINNLDAGMGSLRDAIATANGTVGVSDNIAFSPTVTSILLTSGELAITDNLSINGGGVSISGNNASRIFNISNNSIVNIDGLRINDGSVNGFGGGILVNTGSTLNLSNSTLSNNLASGGGLNGGGAIYNNGTTTISNSNFINNVSANFGAAIYNVVGTLNVNNSTFSDNTGLSGAIDNTDGGTSVISNSTFSSNIATNNGGAISVFNGTVSISNSTFFNNSSTNAGANGGAIRNYDGQITISNSILVGNTAANGNEVFLGGGIGTVNFIGTNIVGTNGLSGITGTGAFTGTPITPTGAANTVINTTLADNGGSTRTHALVTGSIAIDASSTTGGAIPTTSDQRGTAANGIRDIGAFEVASPPPVIPPVVTPPVVASPVVTTRPDIDPNKETRQNNENKVLTLSSLTPVAFLSTEDIEFQRLDRFLIIIVELMNKDGGDLAINSNDIWKDANISIFDQSANQDVIKLAIRRSIDKFIGNEFIDLVDVNFDTNEDNKTILLKVRKSPKPAKLLKD